MFNLTDAEKRFEFTIPLGLLNAAGPLPVTGAGAAWETGAVRLTLSLPPMCPAVIEIG